MLLLNYFFAPINPSAGLWFDNLGDNLGGSVDINGPLDHVGTVSVSTTNLLPSGVTYYSKGVSPSTEGYFRMWANDGSTTYPSPTTPASNVWKPSLSGTLSTVTVV